MSLRSASKIALVHHWLVGLRGGERVLHAIAEIFPRSDIFTLVFDRAKMQPLFARHRIHTSFLEYLPKATTWYPHYLPLFPMATERLDLSGYDLIISSDAATLKGVRSDPGAVHICYCHTPTRYVWSGYETYYRAAGPLARLVYPRIAARLRSWDFRAAQRVTHFVANSHNVAGRIMRYYNRQSSVIYPPVDTEYFVPAAQGSPQDYFLVVSSHVPYKRADLAIEAFNRNGRPLVVIGTGSNFRRLQRAAKSNIRFVPWQPAPMLRQFMQCCRALVFPGEEDFGIVLAEAQACGRPVIAFARGGALEIVSDGVTGTLFTEQTPDSLCDAVLRCDATCFDSVLVRGSALRFNRQRFLDQFSRLVERVLRPMQAGHADVPAACFAVPSGRN